MRKVNMVLMGEPGVGKSTFAVKAPKPYFICTDGNYEWLEEFGADMNAHCDISSYTEFKELVDNPEQFEGYDTIVVDLVEDLFKWCESEYCVRNKFEHISDIGFGKGYDITRTGFINTIFKLFTFKQSVILITHAITVTEKDRRGVEHTKYMPSARMPDKVWDAIEGRVRYFLRAYVVGEEIDGKMVKNRYISFVPKENEPMCIARGIDENAVPHDIKLDWNEFAEYAKLNVHIEKPEVKKEVEKPKEVKKTEAENKEEPVQDTVKIDKIAEIKRKLEQNK